MNETSHFPALFLVAILAVGCGPVEDVPTEETPPDPALAPAEAFFEQLAHHCGNAYPGSLTLAPEGDGMLAGDELLVVHFRECSDDQLLVPFHIEQDEGEWDRSRTWIFRKANDDRLELRHDHRMPDGSEDEVTWYGAFTLDPGTPNRQEFLYEERFDDGTTRGWRVEIEPDQRYTYATIRNGEWRWRVDFDLTAPLDLPPPPPWGYEDGSGPPR